jgi:uncharacterized protein
MIPSSLIALFHVKVVHGAGLPRAWHALRCAALIACLATAPALLSSTATRATAAESNGKIKVAFAGDSLVDAYWAGVTRLVTANSCYKNAFDLGRFGHNGTGLTRGDRLYWPREIRRIGETYKPKVFVISIGLNDRQFIVDRNGNRTPWGATDWLDKYRRELDDFLKGAAASHATVLMIGLPVMRDATDNADATDKDKLFAEAIGKIGLPNLKYVEPWRLNPSGTEKFASFGHDGTGKVVPIRASDGDHFTVPGEDLVAAYLFPKILAALSEAGVRLDPCPNIQAKDGG